MKNKKIILMLLSIILLTSCQQKESVIEKKTEEIVEEIDPKEKIDLSLKPNELGDIMVLMYHNIGDVEEEWVRTYDNFKKDLNTLYDKGYRAVSLEDYINNEMDVEEGKTPVIITFDDGNENNFRYIEEEGELKIDPKSAVGIMEEFKKERPDFNTTASFFVMGDSIFGQEEYIKEKLEFLVNNGYSIGNHTIDHRSMLSASDKEYIEEGLGKQVEILRKYLPNYEINTYALCYGERPSNDSLTSYLEEGDYEGNSYKNIGILNVGWNPAKSPLHKDFEPLSIPRIRASEMNVDNVGLYNWLEYFDNNPEERYISDGVRDITSIPEKLKDNLNIENIDEDKIYIY